MKKISIFFIFCSLLCYSNQNDSNLAYIFTPKGKTDSLTKNKQIVRDFYEAFRKGDLAKMDDLLAPNYKIEDSTVPFNPPHSPFESFSRKIGVRTKALHQALPQFTLKINEVIAEGNHVFANIRISGVQRGRFLGAQPTNKPITIRIFAIITVREGKISQINELWNQLSVMKQMGYIIL